MISAIVLAAGMSRRMGTNKLLLPLGEHTVLEHVIAVLQACPLDDIVVVTGHEPDKIRGILDRDVPLERLYIRTAHNPAYAAGEMFSSIQTGLRALRDDCQAALIVLGDQPQIERRMVERVLAAHEPGRVVIPSYNRRGGHPILIDRACWLDILACPPDANLRALWHAHPDWPRYIDVDSNTILHDMDTPEDYYRLSGNITAPARQQSD